MLCSRAALVLGPAFEAVLIFYALIGQPTRQHQNEFRPSRDLALLLIRQRYVDEIRANDVGASAGGGLLDNLNFHDQSLHSRLFR